MFAKADRRVFFALHARGSHLNHHESSKPALSADPINLSKPRRGIESPKEGASPPLSLTSLDGLETIDGLRLRGSHAQRRIHASWVDERTKIVLAFARSEDERLIKRAGTLASCCANPMIILRESGKVSLCPIRCRDRLCPLCALRRAREAATKYGAAVAAMGAARHLVLTAPSVAAPLREQLKEMGEALKRLRSQHAWKRRVCGGLYTIEITRNEQTGLWHPHLHVIIDGGYFPHAELCEAWRLALRSGNTWSNLKSEDSVIVHISAVHDRKQLARYIAKYIAKPAALGSWPNGSICEYGLAVAGRRMMHTFGSLHGVKLAVEDPNEFETGGRMLMSICELDWRGVQGHKVAREAIALLQHLFPQCRAWFGTPFDPVIGEWASKVAEPEAELATKVILSGVLTCSRPPISPNINYKVNKRNINTIATKNQFELFEKVS